MELIAFNERFPKLGFDECRSAVLPNGGDTIPPGSYAFIEYYCSDPECDCRRVMLVVTDNDSGGQLAFISFGFDRNAPDSGPFLDPMNPQSECADELLELAEDTILSDPQYVARLERHYQLFKTAPKGETAEVVEDRIARRKAGRQRLRKMKNRKKRSRQVRR